MPVGWMLCTRSLLLGGDDALRPQALDHVEEGLRAVLVVEEAEAPALAHPGEGLQRAAEVGVRVPPGRERLERVWLQSAARDDLVPHRTGVAHLLDQRRRVPRVR